MFFKRLLLGSCLTIVSMQTALAAPEPTQNCPTANSISKTFSSGALWKMCAEMRPAEGLVLSQVYYAAPNKTPRRVLGEASLSQLEILTDNTTAPSYVVTQQGLGKNTISLTLSDCPQGNLKFLAGKSICRSTQTYGYQYKFDNQRQGSFFELVTSYAISSRTYSLRWRFYENGIIEPGLGISGQLTKAADKSLENFTAHAGWRLDFDLGTTGNDDQLLQVTSTPSEDRLTKAVSIDYPNKEFGANEDPEIKRFWVIRDGNTPLEGISIPSYDIVPNNYNYSRLNSLNEPWLQKDIYVSRYNACERYATDNRLSNCPVKTNNLAKYVSNKELIGSADSVIWYRQTYHYVARNDDNGKLGTIWSSFQLVPRDWHSQNQF